MQLPIKLFAEQTLLAGLLFTQFGTAFANDSTAVLAAGGLRLEKSESIAILSEKLRISPHKISVDYEMLNISDKPIESILAFPLPPLEGPMIANTPVDLASDEPIRFIEFKTVVDGVALRPEMEMKAFAIRSDGSRGEEVSDLLSDLKILKSPFDRNFYDELAELPAESIRRLSERQLVDIFETGKERNVTPLWRVEIAFYSRQRFEPKKILHVHHEYTPVVGRALFGNFSFTDDLKKWCVDSATEKALRKVIEERPVLAGWEKIIEQLQVDYVLRTGANWAGPIRKFELTIAKEHPKQIVSLCAEGLKRISDTEFQLSQTNYTPKDDLSILFFEPTINGR